jgi:plastocyanin
MSCRRGAALALCGLGTALLAACGNGVPPGSGSSGGAASGGGASVGTAGTNLGTAAVKIQATDQLQFSPSSQSASVGQVIEWTNPGTVAHTITFDTATSLSDPTIAPGGTWEVKFSKAGTYTYKCTIHPGMDGKLTVS